MTDEERKGIKEQIEKAKKIAIDFINSADITEDGRLTASFVLFPFTDEGPRMPIALSVDADIFKVVADDFGDFLATRAKEEKIMRIPDEKMRTRLLNNLHSKINS